MGWKYRIIGKTRPFEKTRPCTYKDHLLIWKIIFLIEGCKNAACKVAGIYKKHKHKIHTLYGKLEQLWRMYAALRLGKNDTIPKWHESIHDCFAIALQCHNLSSTFRLPQWFDSWASDGLSLSPAVIVIEMVSTQWQKSQSFWRFNLSSIAQGAMCLFSEPWFWANYNNS